MQPREICVPAKNGKAVCESENGQGERGEKKKKEKGKTGRACRRPEPLRRTQEPAAACGRTAEQGRITLKRRFTPTRKGKEEKGEGEKAKARERKRNTERRHQRKPATRVCARHCLLNQTGIQVRRTCFRPVRAFPNAVVNGVDAGTPVRTQIGYVRSCLRYRSSRRQSAQYTVRQHTAFLATQGLLAPGPEDVAQGDQRELLCEGVRGAPLRTTHTGRTQSLRDSPYGWQPCGRAVS